MISGLDSAYPPSATSIALARSGGIRLWAGYFAGPNILNGWAEADFRRVKSGGLVTFAYCSGWADAAAMRAQSDAWGVPICLDVEDLIRQDGLWVQSWLDTARAGLYGNPPVFTGRHASFYVLAAYFGGDPSATWWNRMARPSGPCGWQWQGSHGEFGANVDRGTYDDAFLGAFGPGAGSIGDDMLDPHFLAQLVLLTGIGRVATGGGEQFLVDIINEQEALRAAGQPSDFTGRVLGTIINSPEGQAWAAKLDWLRKVDVSKLGLDDDSTLAQQILALQEGLAAVKVPTTGTIAGPITVKLS